MANMDLQASKQVSNATRMQHQQYYLHRLKPRALSLDMLLLLVKYAFACTWIPGSA
jgi:hypothetical protein